MLPQIEALRSIEAEGSEKKNILRKRQKPVDTSAEISDDSVATMETNHETTRSGEYDAIHRRRLSAEESRPGQSSEAAQDLPRKDQWASQVFDLVRRQMDLTERMVNLLGLQNGGQNVRKPGRSAHE